MTERGLTELMVALQLVLWFAFTLLILVVHVVRPQFHAWISRVKPWFWWVYSALTGMTVGTVIGMCLR